MVKHSVAPRPAGPTGGLPYLGDAFKVRRDPLRYFGNSLKTYGDIVRFKFANLEYFLLNSPETIKHVLLDKARNYVRGPSAKSLKYVLGEGLITNDGDSWLRQRKLAQPAFHRDRLAEFARRMTAATEEMLARWATRAARGPLDMQEEMFRVTLDIVGRTLLSQRLDNHSEEGVGKAMAAIVRLAEYAGSPIAPPRWVPTPANIRFKRAKQVTDDIVNRVIAERRAANAKAAPGEPGARDLLGMLMDARDDETNQAMTDLQLRDEVWTMIMAGHETTANALSWTLYLLARHPEAMAKVEAEVTAVLGPRAPGFEDMAKLSYTLAVIQESMRLYPPIWGLERKTVADDVIGGYPISAGTLILIFPYLVHRNPALWPDPEVFKPERFTSGAERSRFAYLPFGGGPRICIGNAFATMEAQIVLAMIIQRYRFALAPDARIEFEQVLSLRPKHGMPMTITPRA
ncbi:MAG: cytochrome P450 [Myxococcales bacterium]|nr:cytochrome P450 [Myxococcales bacterium]